MSAVEQARAALERIAASTHPSVWIEQNLSRLIEEQEAATSGASPTVQPPESEPVR